MFCNSCVHWFWDLRGSVLWGCTHTKAETGATALTLPPTSPTAHAVSYNGATSGIDDEDLF